MTNQTQKHDRNGDNDLQAIQNLTERWLAAVSKKDIKSLVSMVTEDVVFLPPNLPPIRGKAAVEALYDRFFPQFRSVEQKAQMEEVIVAGDWAFTWGTETFVLVSQADDPQTGGSQIQMEGKGMSILRRQPDGSWKFARGINNILPKATPR